MNQCIFPNIKARNRWVKYCHLTCLPSHTRPTEDDSSCREVVDPSEKIFWAIQENKFDIGSNILSFTLRLIETLNITLMGSPNHRWYERSISLSKCPARWNQLIRTKCSHSGREEKERGILKVCFLSAASGSMNTYSSAIFHLFVPIPTFISICIPRCYV